MAEEKIVYEPPKRNSVNVPATQPKAEKKLSKKEPKTPGTVMPEKAEVVEKPKVKRQKKTATVVEYPLDARINAYNFMRFSKELLTDLGWHVDMIVKVDKNADESITLRKV